MLQTILPLAMGPVGGIDSLVAVKWVLIWTAIMGFFLYGAVIFYPPWVDLGEEVDHSHVQAES
jgi:hypothetical protein